MKHIMLDLETFGTRPGSALRSIGAVAFDLDAAISGEFYRNISRDSCWLAGLTLDAATLAWWARQSREAEAALLADPRELREVVGQFHAWFVNEGAEFIWSHGANFDEPLWSAAAAAVQERVPWKFWNVRCTRTLFHMRGFDPRSVARAGIHHNARDDARHQARCVQAAMRRQEPVA